MCDIIQWFDWSNVVFLFDLSLTSSQLDTLETTKGGRSAPTEGAEVSK